MANIIFVSVCDKISTDLCQNFHSNGNSIQMYSKNKIFKMLAPYMSKHDLDTFGIDKFGRVQISILGSIFAKYEDEKSIT
jgi:hypothetical protein